MPTYIPNTKNSRALASNSTDAFRNPHYDCQEMSHALKLIMYVPGVDSHGVEIRTQGADLVVTARKAHVVRVNWQALHLENAQRDYQLRLRLGQGLDYDALQANLFDGILTLTIPKVQVQVAAARQRSVA